MQKVLVVDDDVVLRESLQKALKISGFIVDSADNGENAVNKVRSNEYDLVVMDVNMPVLNGLDALAQIKEINNSIIVIILTAFSNINDAVKAVKNGAYNYLEKPIKHENLAALIKRALKARSLVETSAFSAPTSTVNDLDKNFVGQSDVMQKVFNIISKLAQVDTPVLIRGESGTGKELVAKAIHYNGIRKDEKFVSINLAAIPDELIESELFGHEKGAFTGAIERKIGKFQYADGGTLFLDEIGDISSQMQVKLLRVLQEKVFSPVGSNRVLNSNVRIIAASHRSFEEMIKDGSFREDLFYRLNVLPVYLPPLRDRKADIPILVNYYIQYFNNHHGLTIEGFEDDAFSLITDYPWPGNIRELRNTIEHAFIIESSNKIRINSLPDILVKNQHASDDGEFIDLDGIRDSVLDDEISSEGKYEFNFPSGEGELNFQEAKDIFEKTFIETALEVNIGKINQTALKANIPKKTLLRKIEKYSINPKDFYKK
jgi:two-component system, NtrC family, response regulator HydG